jgi:hypothetical protein
MIYHVNFASLGTINFPEYDSNNVVPYFRSRVRPRLPESVFVMFCMNLATFE